MTDSYETLMTGREESRCEQSRRSFVRAFGSATVGVVLGGEALCRAPMAQSPRRLTLYVGIYTTGTTDAAGDNRQSEGIYSYRLHLDSGRLEKLGVTGGVVNPSFLALAPGGRYLYAVNEVEEFGGQPTGAVSAFAVDRRRAELRLLNREPSHGGAPCYVTIDRTGRFALVANYSGGSVSVLPLGRDGRLGAATDLSRHSGSGPNAERQQAPHAHCIVLDPLNRYAFAADLGADRLVCYRFDARRGKLAPAAEPWVKTAPGAGPRHFAFHPGGKLAYLVNELDSSVTALSYDGTRGRLRPFQTIGTLPADYSGENTCADIHVSPSGRFLYVSNRGHDSLACYAIARRGGRLSLIEHVSTRGRTPRNFAIDPTGRFLLAANQNSHNIVVFRLDSRTGRLSPTGHETEVPSPVCLKFAPTVG
jgi:6-phosphogluconolactonase